MKIGNKHPTPLISIGKGDAKSCLLDAAEKIDGKARVIVIAFNEDDLSYQHFNNFVTFEIMCGMKAFLGRLISRSWFE